MNISTELADPFSLPSVRLENKDKLPKDAGIYFVIANNEILYIGQSMCIRERWVSHIRVAQLLEYDAVTIAWLHVDTEDKKELVKLEKEYIALFNPLLNDKPGPKHYVKVSQWIGTYINHRIREEDKRLLEVLAKHFDISEADVISLAIRGLAENTL